MQKYIEISDYIVTRKLNVKIFLYAIKNHKIIYYISNKNPVSLYKKLKRLRFQAYKIMDKDTINNHNNRLQIIDTFSKSGKLSNRELSEKFCEASKYFNDYYSTFYGGKIDFNY